MFAFLDTFYPFVELIEIVSYFIKLSTVFPKLNKSKMNFARKIANKFRRRARDSTIKQRQHDMNPRYDVRNCSITTKTRSTVNFEYKIPSAVNTSDGALKALEKQNNGHWLYSWIQGLKYKLLNRNIFQRNAANLLIWIAIFVLIFIYFFSSYTEESVKLKVINGIKYQFKK